MLTGLTVVELCEAILTRQDVDIDIVEALHASALRGDILLQVGSLLPPPAHSAKALATKPAGPLLTLQHLHHVHVKDMISACEAPLVSRTKVCTASARQPKRACQAGCHILLALRLDACPFILLAANAH